MKEKSLSHSLNEKLRMICLVKKKKEPYDLKRDQILLFYFPLNEKFWKKVSDISNYRRIYNSEIIEKLE